jgi:formylmethanofuran dehydrogenase subunit E
VKLKVKKMSDYEILVEKAKKFHGGLCPGIVMGTRMTIAAMKELGLDPKEKSRDLIVYVEIDRCMTDAVQAITGCSLGHRSLKYVDYGKFAATFINMKTGKAVRVSSVEDRSKDPENQTMEEAIEKLSTIPEEELLKLEEVQMEVPENDIPGFPKQKAVCSKCGERIMDGRDITVDGEVLCKACANDPYYKSI